jgi:hypothetical protein
MKYATDDSKLFAMKGIHGIHLESGQAGGMKIVAEDWRYKGIV